MFELGLHIDHVELDDSVTTLSGDVFINVTESFGIKASAAFTDDEEQLSIGLRYNI